MVRGRARSLPHLLSGDALESRGISHLPYHGTECGRSERHPGGISSGIRKNSALSSLAFTRALNRARPGNHPDCLRGRMEHGCATTAQRRAAKKFCEGVDRMGSGSFTAADEKLFFTCGRAVLV